MVHGASVATLFWKVFRIFENASSLSPILREEQCFSPIQPAGRNSENGGFMRPRPFFKKTSLASKFLVLQVQEQGRKNKVALPLLPYKTTFNQNKAESGWSYRPSGFQGFFLLLFFFSIKVFSIKVFPALFKVPPFSPLVSMLTITWTTNLKHSNTINNQLKNI